MLQRVRDSHAMPGSQCGTCRFTTPTLAKIFEEFPQRIQAARKHALMNSNGASSASDEDPPAEKQLL